MKTAAATMAAGLMGALLSGAPASATANGYGCVIDTYWETDAHGIVTAYPAAVCSGRPEDRYTDIHIDTILSVNGESVDSSNTAYTGQLRPPGTYPATGVSGRNGPGTDDFCVSIVVNWSLMGQLAGEANEKSCVVR